MRKDESEPSMLAYAVSLTAGLLMVAGSFLMMGFFGIPFSGWMMGGYFQAPVGTGATYHMMPYVGGWFLAAWVGVVAGTVVIVGALLLYARPEKSLGWGTLILVSSALSLLGMGGFYFGAILGIVGGTLAIGLRHHDLQATR